MSYPKTLPAKQSKPTGQTAHRSFQPGEQPRRINLEFADAICQKRELQRKAIRSKGSLKRELKGFLGGAQDGVGSAWLALAGGQPER